MAIVSQTPQFVGASLAWQNAMKNAVRSGAELCRRLGLPAESFCPEGELDFPVFVPEDMITRMRPGDPCDPLLLQVLPQPQELNSVEGFGRDPVGDRQAVQQKGLLQKYCGRALLITTGVCAIHCRYCFRRHFPYQEQSATDLSPAIEALHNDSSISEIILSGGDPLIQTDERLSKTLDALEQIPHLTRLRIHTRLPIVIPSRVTAPLLERLQASRFTTWLVVHANHPQEISSAVAAALGRIVQAGIPTLNQSVLLRGVNDDLDALCDLSLRLIDARVTPYYLHLLDRVAGAAHFDVSQEIGEQLVEGMRRRLPGYAVPRLVREVEGDFGKTFVS